MTSIRPRPSLRRGFFSRLGVHASSARSRDLPTTIDSMNRMSLADDDASSIRTVLPAYPYGAEPQNRPPSPAPTYNTIDQPRLAHPVHPADPPKVDTRVRTQAAVEELVIRIRESFQNPKSWRLHNDGRKSFFWALRCVPGTADILHDSIHEIRERVVGKGNWRVEKFCFIFRGQKLVDLWCRPIDPAVNISVAVTNWKRNMAHMMTR
jgi:hypothetical protein